jgi:hypothetical protein
VHGVGVRASAGRRIPRLTLAAEGEQRLGAIDLESVDAVVREGEGCGDALAPLELFDRSVYVAMPKLEHSCDPGRADHQDGSIFPAREGERLGGVFAAAIRVSLDRVDAGPIEHVLGP